MIGVLRLSPRFNIETVPLVSAYLATDAQGRIRLSADLIALFQLRHGSRVVLGYDAAAGAIAFKRADNDADPTAATVDKRGYVSARRFFRKTQIDARHRRYEFAAEQDGWLVFLSGD